MENSSETGQLHEQTNEPPQIEFLRDYTSVQDENSPVILVNPAHGNEPYILGTAIAQGVSKKLAEQGLGRAKIVVPLMYGERQKRILIEENPDSANLIHFDEEFGRILRDITFQNGDFSSHLQQINHHYDDVESMLKGRFSFDAGDFQTRNLASSETQFFSPRNVVATIDTAARVVVEAPNRYFAFPILLTELLGKARDANLGFSDSDMQGVISRMLKVEAGYSQVFIPKINPLSYKYADDLSKQPAEVNGRTRTYTPAMKREYSKELGKVSEPGIYMMFSGTGSNAETTRMLTKTAQDAGLTVYTPPWVDIEGSVHVTPEVLNDVNIKAVFGRGGWGTVWQVQNLALPWIVTPYEAGDDPEIYFNNKTIEALKMGKVLTAADMTSERLTEIINNFSVGTQMINEKIKDEFGTLDGINFISRAIADDFIQKKK